MVSTEKAVWGVTASQKRLDRRAESVFRRFGKLGLIVTNIEEDIEKMRQAGNEAGLRSCIEVGERDVAFLEKAHKEGSRELVDHLFAERDAGRLPDDKDWEAAAAGFMKKKQAERDEAARQEIHEKTAREEPVRRAQEIRNLMSRINKLPAQVAVPLRRQLEVVPINGKPRDYRKAVYAVQLAVRKAEGQRK